MSTKSKELTKNQQTLMDASSKESVRDWKSSPANERLRLSRVMIKKLIHTGDSDTLGIVAEYYGIRLEKEEEN